LPHPKSADHRYFRLKFNPKSIILLNAMLFALCAVLLPAAQAVEVTLGWDSNPEPDLEGYVVHRNAGYPGPPYDYSDTLPEDELADPLHPKATLTGLQEGERYFIALTAYNTDGIESRFSNYVCVEVVNGAIESCAISFSQFATRGSGSGGSSSNAGCFISASSAESSMFSNLAAAPGDITRVITITILLLILIAAVKLKKLKAGS
jgi:hypothetical protein